MEFAVSTVGKKEVKVFWDIAASGSASKYTRFQYTLDVTPSSPKWEYYIPTANDSPGVALAAGGLYVLDVANSTLLQRSADLSSIPGIENNAKFGFRVITANAPGASSIARADGTSADYSTVGTVKYDMVTVTGVDLEGGSTFEDAYPGKIMTDVAPNGLTYLANYGFGGSEGVSPTLPIMDNSDPTKLKLIVVVRTNINLGGETTTDLAGGWITSGVAVDPSTDASPVPANTARKVISVDRGLGPNKFLRATITR
jgi:hypothetical protein